MPDIILRTHKNGHHHRQNGTSSTNTSASSMHPDYATRHFEKYLKSTNGSNGHNGSLYPSSVANSNNSNTSNPFQESNHHGTNHRMNYHSPTTDYQSDFSAASSVTTSRALALSRKKNHDRPRSGITDQSQRDDDSENERPDAVVNGQPGLGQHGSGEHGSDSELQTLSQTVRALKRKKDSAVNFTTASATLSAAAKIYSCRVDATYNETYRVLGTLSEVKEEELTQNNSGAQGNKKTGHRKWTESPRDEWERRYCEPRSIFAPDELLFDLHQYVARHRQICKTLSRRNHAKIRYKESDQLQSSDPLFHKMSTLFDTQGAKVWFDSFECGTIF